MSPPDDSTSKDTRVDPDPPAGSDDRDTPSPKPMRATAPTIPAPPKIPPPPSLGARKRTQTYSRIGDTPLGRRELALGLDHDDDEGPLPLHKITAGPARAARATTEPDLDLSGGASAGAHADTPETSAGASDDGPTGATEGGADAPAERSGGREAESSGRSGLPRLPVPGMLQGDSKPKAPEFRSTRKAAKASPLGPGILPPGGVLPPSASTRQVEPESTDVLIEAVAAELVQAEESEAPSEEELAVVAASASASGAAASQRGAVLGAAPAGAAADADQGAGLASDPRRWMYLAAGLAGLLLLVVWISRDDDQGPPPPDAKSAQAQVPPPARDDDGEAAAAPTPIDADADAGGDLDAPEPAVIVDTGEAPEANGSTSGAEDEALDGAGATGEDEMLDDGDDGTNVAEASSPSPSASKSGSGSGTRRKTKPREKPSEPAPAPATSKPKPEASGSDADAATLLKQAKAAYRAGNGVKAYGLASKSNRIEPSTDALEVMALASCLKGDKDRARDLLKRLPLFNRPGVRSKCKSHGIKLGL